MIMSRAVKIISPGMLTTVQDKGRFAHQRFGVAVTGVMDRFSSEVANFLVGNDANEAVLEVTLMGPAIEILGNCAIAVTGGDLTPTIDGKPLPMWQCVHLTKGSVLRFGTLTTGARSYIAFAGGIDVPQVMGSRSTYIKGGVGGFHGRPLKAGDILGINRTLANSSSLPEIAVPECLRPRYGADVELRVVLGPQDDCFTQNGITALTAAPYTVSQQCDRMGYRLEGEPIEHKDGADIISDGIVMGSVQVPGNGQPIILMADRQTTGGYTKIATVITPDLPLIAQAKPGTRFNFRIVTMKEAQDILKLHFHWMKSLKQNCSVAAQLHTIETPVQPVIQTPPQPVSAPLVRRFSVAVDDRTYTVTISELKL